MFNWGVSCDSDIGNKNLMITITLPVDARNLMVWYGVVKTNVWIIKLTLCNELTGPPGPPVLS
jgi:hypothetical protein